MTILDRGVPSVLAVGTSLQAAAGVFGTSFADLRVATYDDLADELAGGHYDVVAVAAGPAASRALAAVLDHPQAPTELLLEVPTEPGQVDELCQVLQDKRAGIVGGRSLGPTQCLLVGRDATAGAMDPRDWLVLLAGTAGASQEAGSGAASASPDATSARLRLRVTQLEHQERALRRKLEAAKERAARARTAEERSRRELDGYLGSLQGRLTRRVAQARAVGRGTPAAARRTAKLAAAAGLVLLLVVVAAVVAGFSDVGLMEWAVLASLLLVLALTALVILMSRQLERRLTQLDEGLARAERDRRRLVRSGVGLPGKDAQRPLGKRLTRLEALTSEVASGLRSAHRPNGTLEPGPVVQQFATLLARQDERQVVSTATLLAQIQAVQNLFALVPVRAAVPPMTGWAASPDLVLTLMDEILDIRPGLVVECGSGVTTLWTALVADHFDLPTRVVALEHDADYAAHTRRVLERHGVQHRAEVRHAPLRPVLPGHDTPWYDESALEGLDDIGLLFVDGPPGASGPLARYPAVPLLADRLAPVCTVMLDDFARPEEHEVALRWRELLPEFDYSELPLHKGAAVLRRR